MTTTVFKILLLLLFCIITYVGTFTGDIKLDTLVIVVMLFAIYTEIINSDDNTRD